MARIKLKKKDISDSVDSVIGESLNFYAAEAYKRLRTNISFCIPGDGHCRIIGVTSALRGEGKTTTSINLAYMLAQDNKRVMLIDGDMRLSQIADRTGVARKPGLSELLSGNKSDVVQKSTFHPNLYVISAGENPPNPSELLGCKMMGSTLKLLQERMDYIILDLPPITEVVDALVVGPKLDGIIMVVRRNYARRRAVSTALQQFEQANVKILGFVLNYAEGFNAGFGKYSKYRKYARYGSYGK